MKTYFPNRAGNHNDTDDILRQELKEAGILTWKEHDGITDNNLNELFRNSSGEVKTSVWGILHGWIFKRCWKYWTASGPGIDVNNAEKLNDKFGDVVRVDGRSGLSPRKLYKGLGSGYYHVDTAEGLKALADTIKDIVSKSEADLPLEDEL